MSETLDPRDVLIAELYEVIKGLRATVARLEARVTELEAQLQTNSSNSSKPPSSDGPGVQRAPKAKPSGKSRGGQLGHKAHVRKLSEPTEVVRHEPSECGSCGSALSASDAASEDGAIWEVAELPELRAHITHHVPVGRRCRCGHATRGVIPAPISCRGYGPRFSALVSFLMTRFGLSRRDVVESAATMFGIVVSSGTVCALASEMGESLSASHAEALASVQASPVAHADETGWKTAKKRGYLWVGLGQEATVFLASMHRSRASAHALLGATFAGTLVSDRYNAYGFLPLVRRQLCLAHLLREAKKMALRGGKGAAVGRGLAVTFRAAIALFHRPGAALGTLAERGKNVKTQCDDWLARGAALTEPRDAEAKGLCVRLQGLRTALWTFLTTPGVEPTNNPAERAIRPAVIVRKSSFGSDTEKGALHFARILTAIATLRRQGRSVLDFLNGTIAAGRAGLAKPKLLAEAAG